MKRLVLLCSVFLCLCMMAIGAGNTTAGKSFLTGVIYDEYTNKPVPNLKVFADSRGALVAVTDSKGAFKYPVKPQQTEVQILPYSKDIVGRSVFVNVKEFQNKVVKIVVERGMKLKVIVRDPKGKPIQKARATYMPGGGASGLTNKDGVAVIGMVSRFRDGTLTVKAPGFQTWVRNEMYAPLYTDKGITVTLTPEPPKQKP